MIKFSLNVIVDLDYLDFFVITPNFKLFQIQVVVGGRDQEHSRVSQRQSQP